MAALTTQQMEQLKSLLDKRERILTEDVQRQTNSRDDYQRIAGEAPDTGDQSTADLTIDLSHAEVSRDVGELREIASARDRMQKGEYGFCQRCGADIPFERLLVQPTATRCEPCQSIWEKTHAQDSRGTSL